MENNGKLGLKRTIGYGIGDFAFNMTFTFCSLFLLYFYTDILGLSASTAGLVIMVALIWEGVTDPIVGFLANKNRSRWGRYRPFLLWGSVPLALAFAAMFLPLGLAGSALAAYAFATHLLFRTVYTVVNIPYIALSAQITQDSMERGKLAGARMMFAISAGLLLAALSLPLANALGGGVKGFALLSLVYGIVSTLILLICFKSTSESAVFEEENAPSFAEMVNALKQNRPFLILLMATVLGSVGYTMSGKALVYYMKYRVGSEAAVTGGLVTTLAAAALMMIPWVLLMKKTSKRNIWLMGAMMSSSAFAAIYLTSPTGGAALYGLLAIIGAGNAAFILAFWSMLPDTVEYGEWKTQSRAEGPIFGLMVFSQKIALGIGTGMVGILLDWIGYVPNKPQSAATLHGILMLYSVVPLILYLSAAALIWFYSLDHKMHAHIRSMIDERKAT